MTKSNGTSKSSPSSTPTKVPAAMCARCGGPRVQCARTQHTGHGESRVAYLQYYSRCTACGLEQEDPGYKPMNRGGHAAARAISKGA